MRYLSFIIWLLISAVSFAQQSPHGSNFKTDCNECHTPNSWRVNISSMQFKHVSTGFALEGQHSKAICKDCHATLKFSEAKTDCNSCHRDIHKSTVGMDCRRCHTPESWIVKNMNLLHQSTRFPLPGVHKNADCKECHTGAQGLDFSVKGVSCYDCHSSDFQSARNPNHLSAQFSKECSECHSALSSSWRKTNFAHDFFPLTGSHKIENCYACHSRNTYTGLNKECYACHRRNFESVKNPDHIAGNFSTNCQICHSINGWKPANFNHANAGFQLVGKHLNVVCQNCHTTGYTNTPKVCGVCHDTKYRQTTNPNHISAGFPNTCETCHTPNGWTSASFEHDGPYFPIYSGGHKNKWNACSDCHTTVSNYKIFSCISCHEHNQAATNQQHINVSGYSYESSACLACHPRGSNQGAFNHQTSRFPLTGAHIITACDKCHTSGFASAPSMECNVCHQTVLQQAANPKHTMSNFPQVCLTCHTTNGWKPSSFSHNATQFQLSGKHTTTLCNDCHTTQYSGTTKECVMCHSSDRSRALDPNHSSSFFPQDCSGCHNSAVWKPSTFNHTSTQFQLTGAHTTASCNKCHTTQYTGTAKVCENCHQVNLAATTNPDHRIGNFPQQCTTCHTTTAWKPSTFSHSSTTFPLTGAHTNLLCNKCHAAQFANTQKDCYSCHQADYQNSTNPNHIAAGLPTTCTTCHTTTQWTGAVFNHDAQYFPIYSGKHKNTWTNCSTCHTNVSNYKIHSCIGCHEHDQPTMNLKHQNVNGYQYESNACLACHPRGSSQGAFNHQTSNFPLTGAHASAQCAKCHTNGYLTPPSTECSVCHQAQLQQTTNPKHLLGNFPQTCTTCHTTTAWKPSSFNHQTTQFQLSGKHLNTLCNDCHTTQYASTSKDCKTCHCVDRSRAQDPNHTTAFFPQDCNSCHTTSQWKPSSFDHAGTRFLLTGAHTTASCNKCHTSAYTGTPKICFTCHQSNLSATTNPNHLVGNFSQECTSCHTTAAWKPSTFNHSTTQFVLTGAHTTALCSKCHSQTWSGTAKICYSCHQQQFQTGTNPNHTLANFSQNCETCHTTAAWKPSSYNHTITGFTLTGKHLTTACNQCHATAYANTPTACDGCHHPDFIRTTNPNHVTSLFPVTCATCHTTVAWTPVNYNHDVQYFPIYSGKHKNRWTNCNQCHTNSANYQVYTCMGGSCHAQATTNSHHSQVSGYTYVASECYRCHPNGSSGKAVFNHGATQFPLAGAHIALECSQCHTGAFAGTPKECFGCHKARYDATTVPPHERYNFSQICATCHTQSAWKPAQFNHNHFPLSVKHRILACTECHSQPNYRPQCLSCHRTNFESGHHSTGSTACWECHSTTSFIHDPAQQNKKND